MLYVFLVIIIVLLFHLKSVFKHNTQSLRDELRKLDKKLDKVSAAQRESPAVAEKPVEDRFVAPEPPVAPKKNIPDLPEPAVALTAKEQAPSQPVLAAKPVKRAVREARPNAWERFKQKNPDLEKFIGENLINKIGVLILVLGVSYFVKFAIDKNWINEPARVGIGILAGSLVLFVAHKLRTKYAPFSSVLVAGAIAIYYFTIAIAFHEYQLFGQTVAFVIMVAITAFSCLISLSYSRMELAILSLIGGFLVPFMISTGSGNYVVLFTYIAILDIGILAMAYFKKWQPLHILAFVLTTLLFGSWVVREVYSDAPHYQGALLFGFIFYLIFLLTNMINNLRTKGTFSWAQLSMLTINTFVFYGVGVLVLTAYKPEFLGLFTAFLAVLNLGYALLLYKKFGLDKNAVYLLIGLTLTFITLAVPVQFSGNNITVFWAVEAVLLMWLAQKSQVKSYRFAAVVVQLLMLVSLLMDWFTYFDDISELNVILNPIFITGIMVVGSLVGVAFLLQRETDKLVQFGLVFNPVAYRKIAVVAAIGIGYFVGLFETGHQAFEHFGKDAASAITVLYHLIFFGVLSFVLYRNRPNYDKLINVLAIANIIAFALFFSMIPFSEHRGNVATGSVGHMAYYLHLVSLVIIGYFCYLVYSTNYKQRVFPVFKHPLAIWGSVALLVFIASSEVVLQGLQFMDFPLDPQQYTFVNEKGQLEADYYRKIDAARALIGKGSNKIVKTGFPVLWGILAFVFLLVGIKKQLKQLRIIALSLLGITIVKLFVYDISNVSETGKIIAFILLGVLVLVISFVYQKIKVLVIDEDKKNQDDKVD